MLRYFCSKKKNKSSNSKNNCNTIVSPEINYPCDNNSSKQCIPTAQNNNLSKCEDLKKQSELYSFQANCAKEQAIALEKQAKELEYEISCIFNEANEFWNQYEQLTYESNIYMNKANCCFNQTSTNTTCNPQCNCNKQHACVPSNKPIVFCKKSGSCGSIHGN